MDKSGVRIQKVLSDNGIMSRRKAEEAIRGGRITVNGRPCEIGQKVNSRRDILALDGVNLSFEKKKSKLYIMLNKPRGYVTTMQDEMGRKCVIDLLEKVPGRVYPVGRLDKNSEGLLLLTNDGAFANTIMHPSHEITKTYRATVRPEVTEEQLVKLSSGMVIDGKMTLPASVHVLTQEENRVVLQITIHEGRNRQVRKMCEAVGLEIVRLKRISIGPLKLGMLAPGTWRELKPIELTALRASVTKSVNRASHEKSRGKSEGKKKFGRGGNARN